MHLRCSRLSSTVRAGAAACCCGLLILAGCNSGRPLGKLVPVQGKVILNGTPLPDGEVTFIPIERDENAPPPSQGIIEADGSYTLTTKGKPGVPLGKYRAVMHRGEEKKLWRRVDPKYYSQQKSPLEIEVVENKPEGGYDLKLQPRAPSR